MPWMLLLHIVAIIGWCGILLYLSALIISMGSQEDALDLDKKTVIPRQLFTKILTPMALVAIFSGTVVFLQTNTVALWLITKLSLVSGLVVCHALNGLLILKLERFPKKSYRVSSLVLAGVGAVLMVAIISLVLAKPF